MLIKGVSIIRLVFELGDLNVFLNGEIHMQLQGPSVRGAETYWMVTCDADIDDLRFQPPTTKRKIFYAYIYSHPTNKISSISMQNWVSHPKVLQQLSSHFIYQDGAYMKDWMAEQKDGEPLPPKKASLHMFD